MRTLVLAVLLSLAAVPSSAQQETAANTLSADETRTRLQHKISMVELILTSPGMQERLQGSGDSVAIDLIDRATVSFGEAGEYFDHGKYLEAEAVLDFVLRDLSAASRLLSSGSRIQNSYSQSLRKLDAFEFPEWQALTPEQSGQLRAQLEEISKLRSRALQAADQKDYDTAIGLIDQAYDLKAALLAELPHRQEIVYDLSFDTIVEENEYLNQRAEHYFELVEFALSRSLLDIQTRNLVDDLIYQAVAGVDTARDLEQRERHEEAHTLLEEAIRRMLSVLKILGINV